MKKALRFLSKFFLVFISFGVFLSNLIMYIRKKDDDFILHRELAAGRLKPAKLFNLPRREVLIPSPFGYHLKAVLFEPHNTKKYMIFCHGVTENKINSVKYMELFLKRGFNCLIYDHRRHGESGGKTTSYGHYEKFDLHAVVNWLKKETGSELFLGIHGVSMGAATLLLYAGMIEDGADFYIADCPFSDFEEQLAWRIKKELKIPPKIVLPVADLFIQFREKYSLRDISPISVIDRIKNPVLFIHSKKDDYILPKMTEELYEQKKGPKKLFLAANGVHAQALNENETDYERIVDEFLQKYVPAREMQS